MRPRAKSRHQIEQKKVDKLCKARESPGQNVRCSGAKLTFIRQGLVLKELHWGVRRKN